MGVAVHPTLSGSADGWPGRCFERLDRKTTGGLTEERRQRESSFISALLHLRHPDIQSNVRATPLCFSHRWGPNAPLHFLRDTIHTTAHSSVSEMTAVFRKFQKALASGF